MPPHERILSFTCYDQLVNNVRTDVNTFAVAFPLEADYHDHCPGRWRVDVWLEVLKELWSADKWVESSC